MSYYDKYAPGSPERCKAGIDAPECEALRAHVAELEEALRDILDVCRDRAAFVMLGPRGFARAEFAHDSDAKRTIAEHERDEASRICCVPGCVSIVVRRDDGSRVCAAGHESRWVDRSDLDAARAACDRYDSEMTRVRNHLSGAGIPDIEGAGCGVMIPVSERVRRLTAYRAALRAECEGLRGLLREVVQAWRAYDDPLTTDPREIYTRRMRHRDTMTAARAALAEKDGGTT